MSLRSLVRRARGKRTGVGGLSYDGPAPDDADMSGDLERLFWSHQGTIVHKWLHYFPIYERHLAPYRNTPVRFLEIGVSKGGSLEMWRSYLGPEAVIFGIDIDPACAVYDGRHAAVRIGSQADPAFLARVVDEMGGLDVVLDDGSHDSRHIRQSLDALFPALSDHGTYIIEDLHCAYWKRFSGGYKTPVGFMTTVKTLIDDLHHWYHDEGQKISATKDALRSMHIYDSITVLEKGPSKRPTHAQRGLAE